MKTIAKLISIFIIFNLSLNVFAWENISEKIDIVEIQNTISENISENKEIILKKLNADVFNWFNIEVLKENNLVLENWVWYTYRYTKYVSFWKWVVPTEKSLSRGSINKETTLLLLDDKIWASFVYDYKKVKLISDYVISWITNKQQFLKELAQDKKDIHTDTDELFIQLKKETQELTKWLSDAGKIYKIYNYILNNISYSETFDITKKEIFSWIETYKNKEWICGWYSKLNLYMLSFAWIDDVRVVKWDLIDNRNFLSIGHAWTQIWDKYYDVTFDDPIWNTKAKKYNQYKYYGLNKNQFYVNKYEYGTLPEYLKTTSLKFRKNLVRNNIAKL